MKTKSFTYYNASTGELSDTYNSTSQWKIRTIIFAEKDSNVIYASKIVNK